MAEPTPGRWHVAHTTNIMAGRDCIATCGGRQTSLEPERTRIAEENAANARLMASAPALLRELRHLVRLLEPLERAGSLQVPGLATLNGARKAIEEATGEGGGTGK